MKNLEQLTKYIRFQLSQLKSSNKHHEFENLTRWFARKKICSQIIPATGPVSAGGDQGRDFETYRSYLISTPLGSSAALGITSDKLVFACSLQEKIDPKIRSDVNTICGGPTKPDRIYYFAEKDIPIARRQELQKWAKDSHAVELEILDGQALSEGLTDPDVFWIAQEYLAISSEHYPALESNDARYSEYKVRWIKTARKPANYADFFEIKYGLRKATFSKDHQPDLTDWLIVLAGFLGSSFPSRLRRQAIYELCVAALRGQDNLDAKANLVVEYFDALDSFDPDELRDAATLLLYCSAARKHNRFDMESSRLHEWTKKLWGMLKRVLAAAKVNSPAARCAALETLGYAGLMPYRKGSQPKLDANDTFRYWHMMLKDIRNAPLFPLEDFADLLTHITPVLGKDERFVELTRRIDELLSKRTSGFSAAEKCRDRALKYMEADEYVAAIKQFHFARVKWFAAETLKGSVLSMLTLATCYQRLGLPFAGAYYALGAALISFRSDDEAVKRLFPQAAFLAADCYYSAGATLTYLQVMNGALYAHGGFARDPGDLETHEVLQRAFAHCAIIRGVTERFQPSLLGEIDRQIAQWPIADEFKSEIQEWSSKPELWTKTLPADEIWQRAQADLVDRPFSDLGSPREIRWETHGLTWVVQHANSYDETRIGEELAATLQIIAADMADTDLCLLPMMVKVKVSLRDGNSCHMQELPDNNVAAVHVQFPKDWLASSVHLPEMQGRIVAIAGAILQRCSALDDKKFVTAVENAFEAGLAGKAFSIRSYAELYAHFITREMFDAVGRVSLQPLNATAQFEHAAYVELSPRLDPGPGYSETRSKEHIANRYRLAIKPIRYSLPVLITDPGFVRQIQRFRERGYKDWFILVLVANVAAEYRGQQLAGPHASHETQTRAMEREMQREETTTDDPVPAHIFTAERMDLQANIMALTVAKTWGLAMRGQTPNFTAYEKLLTTRYGMLEDDLSHEDLFKGA